MLRIVIQTTDFGEAVNIGGPVVTTLRSFDVDIPDLERHLREYEDEKGYAEKEPRTVMQKPQIWWNRSVVGIEVLE